MNGLYQTDKGTPPVQAEQKTTVTDRLPDSLQIPAESYPQFITAADWSGRKQKAVMYARLPERMHRIPDEW